ncbi:Retrovirus-related Pol polyprotein from transposon opus [Gossypium australe]|uniref:Retrovirus-related Pol polyprotein from transposon opus n=1 Tax=Gossypium australe TaxID=47621 RepID=A0A5B6V9W6_9ROSI|nr:Retrovirus-related Pol polyprotein from transposon opus [Gossypium australe]
MSARNPLLIFGNLRGNSCSCLEDVHKFSVYYVSKVLQNGKLRYLKIEKLIFALNVATRKLHPYFQAHLFGS